MLAELVFLYRTMSCNNTVMNFLYDVFGSSMSLHGCVQSLSHPLSRALQAGCSLFSQSPLAFRPHYTTALRQSIPQAPLYNRFSTIIEYVSAGISMPAWRIQGRAGDCMWLHWTRHRRSRFVPLQIVWSTPHSATALFLSLRHARAWNGLAPAVPSIRDVVTLSTFRQ